MCVCPAGTGLLQLVWAVWAGCGKQRELAQSPGASSIRTRAAQSAAGQMPGELKQSGLLFISSNPNILPFCPSIHHFLFSFLHCLLYFHFFSRISLSQHTSVSIFMHLHLCCSSQTLQSHNLNMKPSSRWWGDKSLRLFPVLRFSPLCRDELTRLRLEPTFSCQWSAHTWFLYSTGRTWEEIKYWLEVVKHTASSWVQVLKTSFLTLFTIRELVSWLEPRVSTHSVSFSEYSPGLPAPPGPGL